MTTTTATRTALINADLSHELAAGMTFPVRDALVPLTPARAVALFQARRAFWLAAAEGFRALGCTDAEYDVREAEAQAALYAPSGR